MKWPWWRGVRGDVIIEGQRLDASAPPPQGSYNSEYYGLEGFIAGALTFPSEGCWEVTGRVGDASLTFVTLVVKLPFKPAEADWLPEGLLHKDTDIADLFGSFRKIYGVPIWSEDQVTWDDGELIIETTPGMRESRDPYPEAAQASVIVNGQPGLCIRGALNEQDQWQTEADAGILEWTADDFSYRVSQTGLGLNCEVLLRIAESLH